MRRRALLFSPLRAILLLTLFFLSAVRPSSAQINNITDQTVRPTPGAGHNYLNMLNESVNLANGSLAVRIGVPLPPGRKIGIPFSFAYDSGSASFMQPVPGGGRNLDHEPNQFRVRRVVLCPANPFAKFRYLSLYGDRLTRQFDHMPGNHELHVHGFGGCNS